LGYISGQKIFYFFELRFLKMPNRPMIAAICLFLIVLTVGASWQLKDNAFINYDDNEYVTDNPQGR
jgi:hypothetical protein